MVRLTVAVLVAALVAPSAYADDWKPKGTSGDPLAQPAPPVEDPVPPPSQPPDPEPAPEPPVATDPPVVDPDSLPEKDLKPTIPRARMKDIVVTTPGERSPKNITAIVSVTALALVAGLVGLHQHLDGKQAADEVSAQVFTGEVWTREDDILAARADKARNRAIVAYSIGGGLLLGAIIAFIATAPDDVITVIHPRSAARLPSITPIEGGAIASTRWSW